MADDPQLHDEHTTTHLGADDIATIVKKLQADVQALRYENDTLKVELSTVKSSATVVPPHTIASVARRLSYDDVNDSDQRDTNDVHVLDAGRSRKKAVENIANIET